MAALLRWLFSSTLGMKVVTAGYTDCGCDERHRVTSAVCVSCVCVSCVRARVCGAAWSGGPDVVQPQPGGRAMRECGAKAASALACVRTGAACASVCVWTSASARKR